VGNARGIQAENGLEPERIPGSIAGWARTNSSFNRSSGIWKVRRQSHVLRFLSVERDRGFAGLGYLPMTHKVDKRAARRR
jgi:hypothetical protein